VTGAGRSEFAEFQTNSQSRSRKSQEFRPSTDSRLQESARLERHLCQAAPARGVRGRLPEATHQPRRRHLRLRPTRPHDSATVAGTRGPTPTAATGCSSRGPVRAARRRSCGLVRPAEPSLVFRILGPAPARPQLRLRRHRSRV